jgi:hypothetical protein
MDSSNAAEYNDLYLLASMFGVEFIVIEGRSKDFHLPDERTERDWKFNFQRTFKGHDFINNCLVKKLDRPKKWMACMLESQFMPIISNSNETIIVDNITFMINTFGKFDKKTRRLP